MTSALALGTPNHFHKSTPLHWDMVPPWAPKPPFAIVRRPPIANVVHGQCMYGALQRQKVPPESPSRGFSSLRAPSNDENFLRKVPPMTTVGLPPWVEWRPPSPWPPFPSRFSKYGAASQMTSRSNFGSLAFFVNTFRSNGDREPGNGNGIIVIAISYQTH